MISRPRYARIIGMLLVAAGCGVDEKPPALVIPPTTEIVNPRLSGEAIRYDLLVSWKGFDEDGTLAGFEIAIDDSTAWYFTTSFDSQFAFESRQCCLLDSTPLPGGGTEFDSLAYQPHALFVRAVDNDGNRDPSPDRIMFTATNMFPETVISRGPSSSTFEVTGPTLVLAWGAQDRDGIIASYRYRLDGGPWVAVAADCTRVRFVNLSTAEAPGDMAGFHTFTVFAVDNAGAEERTIDSPANFREWESVDSIGGTVTIDSNVMGSRTGLSGLVGVVEPGVRLAFDWSADLSLYDGTVECYEFALDDTTGWSSCDLLWRHYPPGSIDFEPLVGPHAVFVRARDDLGNWIEARFQFSVLKFGPSYPKVLYVDDFDEGSLGSGNLYPNDGPENAFWDTVLVGYPISTFDCEFERGIPSARSFRTATTVIWYLDGEGTRLAEANNPDNYRNPLPAYLAMGGNLILCGQYISAAFTPDNSFDPVEVAMPGCPHRPRDPVSNFYSSLNWYPAFCDESLTFFYDILKDSVSYTEFNEDAWLGRLKKSISGTSGLSVSDLALDLGKRGNLPDGRPILSLGLEECDQFDLRRLGVDDLDIVIPLWAYVDAQGQEKRVCGFYVPKSTRTSRGHILVLGFPPYFFKTAEMREVFRTFLELFSERCTGPDCGDQ